MTQEQQGDMLTDTISLTYNYALGTTVKKFLDGLKEGKIIASRCTRSGMTYLPPRAYCERSFEPCDEWVEAGYTGVIEASTIAVRGYEGKRKPPIAIAFVRLDGVDSAIANYVDGLDLSDLDRAMAEIAPGRRVMVKFAAERVGRITDFTFKLA
jgi:uncharacterized OB-fold protein